MRIDRCPSSAAMASRLIPRLDGLGGEGVTQPVGVHPLDPGPLPDPLHDPVDAVAVERPSLVGDQQTAVIAPHLGPPGGELVNEGGVERDQPVMVQLADGDA